MKPGATTRGDFNSQRDILEAGPDSDIDFLFVLSLDAQLGFTLFDLEDELAEIVESINA